MVFMFIASLALADAASGLAVENDTVEALRRQAAKASSDLEKATRQWEDRRKRLAQSQVKLRATLRELGQAEAALERIREPLAALANSSFQQPVAAGSMTIFGEGSPERALRSAADLNHMADGQSRLVRQAEELQSRKRRLSSTAQELQSSNAVEQTKLQQLVGSLKQRSAQLTQQLTAALHRLRIAREKRFIQGCDPALASGARRFPNGLIPPRYLCRLPQRGEQLRADAALAFYKLNAAYQRRFGQQMCVRDSYRSLAAQQQIYYSRPGFAAVPGRSNHGRGQAVDLCGGVQNAGSAQFTWLEANAGRFGWFHPQWAYSNPFEPWHWEFGSEGG